MREKLTGFNCFLREHLPVGSVLPKTDVKLLSETNAFVAAAEETVEPLKPILWFFLWEFFFFS